jgi:outer membrane immunogenic protein
MRVSYLAIAAIAALITCNSASAQSTTDILQRLETLENSNADLKKSNADLKKENAAFRDRLIRIESAKQIASTTPAAPSAIKSTVNYPATSAAPVYKSTSIGAPAPWSWTSFYVGANGGFARARTTGPNVSFDEQGGFGGIQMGLNYQFLDHWVLGFEQDVSFGDIKGSGPIVGGGNTGTVTFKNDALGSFRERVGYTWDHVMFYETAGVAWTQAKPNIVITSPFTENVKDNRLMTGLAAGIGIEVATTSNLTVKAEYLFMDFPNKNFFANPALAGTPLNQAGAADMHIHTFKVGVNWLFN